MHGSVTPHKKHPPQHTQFGLESSASPLADEHEGAVRQGGISHDKGVSQALQCRGQVGLRFRHLRDTGYLLIAAGIALRIYIDACGVSRGPPAENPSPLREPSRAKPVQAPGRCVTSTRWHRATAQAGDVSVRGCSGIAHDTIIGHHSGIRITPAVWYRQIFPGKKEIMARQSAAMRKSNHRRVTPATGLMTMVWEWKIRIHALRDPLEWTSVGQGPPCARAHHPPMRASVCDSLACLQDAPAPRARHEEGARGG